MFVKILFCLMVLAAFPKFVASLMCESVVVSFAKIFWYARLVSLHFPFCKYCFFFLSVVACVCWFFPSAVCFDSMMQSWLSYVGCTSS